MMIDLSLEERWAEAFCASPFRLRFELGGDFSNVDATVPRFVRAFGRARNIANDAFLGSTSVLSIVGCWPEGDPDPCAPAENGFMALEQAGFQAMSIAEWKGGHPRYSEPDDEEWQKSATWKAFNLTNNIDDRDVIIWCAVSQEMAVTPKASITPFLVDLESGVLVHVYDDRGMDVISLQREPLSEIYFKHNGWLLDYDRERIVEAFGPLPE